MTADLLAFLLAYIAFCSKAYVANDKFLTKTEFLQIFYVILTCKITVLPPELKLLKIKLQEEY
jgi:hypothetical protein